MKLITLVFGMIVIVVAGVAAAQSSRPQFEVASVKPSVNGGNGIVSRALPGGGYSLTNGTLRVLVSIAYKVRDYQISGGPNWVGTDGWNIEAKAAPTQSGPPDATAPGTLELMLQSLLEDRFQLKIHREVKEAPIYNLTVAKNGPKMKLSPDQTPVEFPALPQPGGSIPRGRIRLRAVAGQLEAAAEPVKDLATVLSDLLSRPVINRTDLKYLYDFKLEWSPELIQGLAAGGNGQPPATANPSGPSLFTAVEEQLGLKLESSKGPVEVLVIDSVQKPTEN
jgi:uncharacterized protein (TIGR03435 family)